MERMARVLAYNIRQSICQLFSFMPSSHQQKKQQDLLIRKRAVKVAFHPNSARN
jgi:hypothetical protein